MQLIRDPLRYFCLVPLFGRRIDFVERFSNDSVPIYKTQHMFLCCVYKYQAVSQMGIAY